MEKTVKDSESLLLINVLVSFTVKYFVSREEMLSKKLVSGSSSGSIVECSFTVNCLKDMFSKFGSGEVDNLVKLFFPLIPSNN